MEPLIRLREICLSLPGATERLSHGEPTWFVKKVFCMYADRHHNDRVAFWCPAPPGIQQALIEEDPAKFFRPPYVGPSGWIGVYLDLPVDWNEIEDIVREAHRCVAPAKFLAMLQP